MEPPTLWYDGVQTTLLYVMYLWVATDSFNVQCVNCVFFCVCVSMYAYTYTIASKGVKRAHTSVHTVITSCLLLTVTIYSIYAVT